MEKVYFTFLDKDTLIKGLALINSISKIETGNYHIYAICFDYISSLLINKLKIKNLTVELNTALDSVLNNLELYNISNSIDSFSLPFAALEFIKDKYPSADSFIFANNYISFINSPDEIESSLIENDTSISIEIVENNINFFAAINSENTYSLLREILKQNLNENPSQFFDIFSTYSSIIINDTKINSIYKPYKYLEFVNEFIILPDYKNEIDLKEIKDFYTKYIEELYNNLGTIRSYISDFSESIEQKDLLNEEHSFIAFHTVTSELEKQKIPYIKSELSDFLYYYKKDKDLTDKETKEIVDYKNYSEFVSENYLLDSLKNKEISNEIKTLYIIGAHKFEERYLFDDIFQNLENIYLFEPIKELYESLAFLEIIDSRIKVFNYAIYQNDEIRNFNLTDNEGASSSLLKFKEHKVDLPFINVVKEIQVQCRNLNSLINEENLSAPDMLFIDTQGAEYEILNSIKDTFLNQVKIIYTEVSKTEYFEGQKLFNEVTELLSDKFELNGFHPLDVITPNHGNALYINKFPIISTNISHPEIQNVPIENVINTKENPDISIIMPTLGTRKAFIKEAINSVINQTKKEFELIIINDGGKDILDIISAFNDERIKYYAYNKNKGTSFARNFGIEKSQGNCICFLDDDDTYFENHLELLYKNLINSGKSVVYSDAFRTEQKLLNAKYEAVKSEIVYSFDFDLDSFYIGNYIPILCIMFKKECLEKSGTFDEKLKTNVDWDLFIRLAQNYEFIHIPTATCQYSWRTDGSSITSLLQENFVSSREYIYNKYYNFVKDNPEIIARQKSDLDNLKDKLYNEKFSNSFSIIIPVFNNLELTKQCLDSILKNGDPNILTEIIIIDNNSNDGSKEFFESIAQRKIIKYIRNDEPKSYSASNNQGASIAAGKYLIFLNNDTVVTKNWLSKFLEIFNIDSEIGVQGAKLLYPDNTIQSCGIVYGKLTEKLTTHYPIYLNAPSDAERVNIGREFQMLTGACLAVKRAVFNKIGGFDEKYYFGFEDLDLCLSNRKYGLKVWYNPEAVVYHYENKTKELLGKDKFERYYINSESFDKTNYDYFMQKWANVINTDDDKYYENDKMYGLISNPITNSMYLQRIEVVLQELAKIIAANENNKVNELLEILFEFPIEAKNITQNDILNISEKRLLAAEIYLNINIQPNEIQYPENSEILIDNSKKMRILFVMFGWNDSGGGTTFPRAIAKELQSQGYQIAVFYAKVKLDRTKPIYSLDFEEEDGVLLYGLYNRESFFTDENFPEREINNEHVNKAFEYCLDNFKPDLIHYHNFHSLSMSITDIAFERNIPSCFTPHNYYIIDPALYLINSDLTNWKTTDLIAESEFVKNNPEKIELYLQRAEKAKELINKTIDITLTISQRQKDLFTNFGCNPDKMIILHQANRIVDELAEIGANLNKKKFTLPLKFGFIGGVLPIKGVHYIAAAAQYFPKTIAEFHIYGFVPDNYKNILNEIDKNSRLIYHNEYKIEELKEFGSKIDVGIIPSICEDCAPMVLLELLSLKIPVIAANIGGISDFIKDNINGFLYKYDSIEELVSKIDYCIRNTNLIEDMANSISQNYRFEKYLNRLKKIYDTLKDRNMDNPFSFELKASDINNSNNDSDKEPQGNITYQELAAEEYSPAPIDSESDEEFIMQYLQKTNFEILDYTINNYDDKDFFDLNLIVRIKKSDNTIATPTAQTASYDNSIQNEISITDEIQTNTELEVANIEQGLQSKIIDEGYQPQLNIVWEGTQFVYHSLALINREQCSNIIQSQAAELTIVPYEDDKFFDENNPKYKALAEHDIRYKNKELSENIKSLPYVWIRHQWPPKAEPPVGAKWIINQPWEFTALRKDHTEIFKQAHEIWTPSNFSRNAFIESGIDFNKVQIIPNGIDPTLFTPEGKKLPIPTLKRFKMLYVGGTIYRKGADILLDAYTSTFTNEDDVCLIIKDIGGDSFYKDQTAKAKIQEMKNMPNAPEIIYIDSKLTEEEMAELYRACDIFISSYRGEGFSLPTLEAMACGLPVMVTEGGSTDDFVDEEVGWLIPSAARPIGNMLDDNELTHEAYLLEPEIDELKKMLKYVSAQPSHVFIKGVRASLRARTQWTWNRATLKMFNRLDSIYGTDMYKTAAKNLVDIEDDCIKFCRACSAYEKNNFDKALTLWNDVILSENLPQKYRVHIYHNIAMHFILNNEIEKGEAILKNILNEIYEHPDNKYLQAVIYAKTEKYPDAYDILTVLYNSWTYVKYDSSLGISLDDLLTLNAEVCFLEEDLETAMTLFTEALKYNNENYDACYGAAMCFLEIGAKDEARNMLEWAVKIKPDFPEAQDELWRLDNE